jgi:signal transduction histidine kinase
MDAINISYIFIILIDLMLVMVSLIDSKESKLRRSVYAIHVLTIIWWITAMFFFRISNEKNIIPALKSLYASAIFITSSFYYFVQIFINSKKRFSWEIVVLLIFNLILAGLILFGNTIIYSANISQLGERTFILGKYYILYVVYVSFFLFISFIKLFVQSKRTIDRVEKSQFLYLAIGYSIPGIIDCTTNLILPWFHYFSLNWFGPAATVFMVIIISYAVAKHRLFSIQVVAAEILIFILWIFTLAKITLPNLQGSFINIGYLLFVIIIGYLLIRSVKKEIEQRIKNQQLAEQLERLNRELKEVDELKSELVSLATHHIATPLTAVKGYVSLIQEGNYGSISEEIKPVIDIVEKSTNSMATIVRDFIDVTLLEDGKIKYNFSNFNLENTIKKISNRYHDPILQKGLQFNFDYEHNSDFIVCADEEKIERSISNIFENSIRYTKKGGISVSLKVKNEVFLIKISDSGERNLPVMSQKLSKKFTQSNDEFEASVIGNGLGLYVAKKMIEAHKGSMKIESKGSAGGMDFFIELPKNKT